MLPGAADLESGVQCKRTVSFSESGCVSALWCLWCVLKCICVCKSYFPGLFPRPMGAGGVRDVQCEASDHELIAGKE